MSHYSLDSTNFPLYSVNSFGNGYFLIAGGGGISKTGIPNAVNVYKIGQDGNKLNAKLLDHYNPGPEAVMNVSVHPTEQFTFAVGMDNKCQIISCKITEENNKGKDEKKQSEKPSDEHLCMKLGPSQVTTNKTDEKSEHYQKCVCFSSDGKHLVTGASDGYVKVLKYPSLDVLHEIKAHESDVDDVAVHPNSHMFVSVSRDATSYVWNLAKGRKEIQLFFTGTQDDEYFYKIRHVRLVKDRNAKECYMYTTHTPSKVQPKSNKNSNYVVKWDTQKWIPMLSAEILNHSPSQLSVSPCGTYVGVGCANGSVQIYSSWNMHLLQTVPDVHGIFVTGLAFLPTSRLTYEILKMDAALLSISVDNNCELTVLPRRAQYSYNIAIVGFFFTIVLIFYILATYESNF